MIPRLFFLILLIVSSAHAATPAAVAIRFAEALRDDRPKEDITPLCCLNPNTGDIKKSTIYQSWKELGEDMISAPFEVVEEKMEKDHAAVVLSQRLGGSTKSFRVFSFAVVREADAWKPAPLLASFENSVVNYSAEVSETRKNLVRWMSQRAAQAREEMANQVNRDFDQAMRQSITPEQLATVEPAALVDGFLQAVRDRNQAAAIARLGGFSQEPTQEENTLHAHIIRCFESSATMREWPWNLITDSRTILVPGPGQVKAAQGGQLITILAIHPESLLEEPQILTFHVRREGGTRWQIQLPEVFLNSDAVEDEDCEPLRSNNRALIDELKKFVKEKRQSQPKDLYATAEGYAKYLTECLTNHDFLRFWVATVPDGIFMKNGRFPEIRDLWQSLQEGNGTSLFALLASKQEKKFLLAVLQSYSPSQGMQIKNFWLKEVKDKQWELLFDEPEDFPEELLAWMRTNEEGWKKTLTDGLTEKAQRIGALANAPVDIEAIRNTFEQWQKAMDAQSLREVIPFCASFEDEKSILAMLRNVARDMIHDTGKRSILQVHQSGRWGAVSGRLDTMNANAKPVFPLYIFVATDVGPRILPQIDYRVVDGNSTRDFLNKNALRDLTKIVPEQTVAELQTIIDAHRKLVAEQPLIPSAPEPAAKQ